MISKSKDMTGRYHVDGQCITFRPNDVQGIFFIRITYFSIDCTKKCPAGDKVGQVDGVQPKN